MRVVELIPELEYRYGHALWPWLIVLVKVMY